MFRISIIMALGLLLASNLAFAQNGAIGTGEDGCYFGKCDDGEVETLPNPQPAPQPNSGPMMCTTHFGNCQMAVQSDPGLICNCPYLANGGTAIGIVQSPQNISYSVVPNVASICQTPVGACQMSVPLGRFQNCFCPTIGGPIWGQSQ